MKPYLVSYDLNRPGQEYPDLINALTRLGAVKVLYSEWALKTDLTAIQLRDHLQKFVDGNDSLLVVGLTGEAAWTRLMVTHEQFKQLIAA